MIKASALIEALQAAIDKVGDLEVVAPWAGVVDNEIEVLTGGDYLDDGATYPGNAATCVGKICLDACG